MAMLKKGNVKENKTIIIATLCIWVFLLHSCFSGDPTRDKKLDAAPVKPLPSVSTLAVNRTIDTFSPSIVIKGDDLLISLKTELPDNAPLYIIVDRIYRVHDKKTGQKQDSGAEYFSADTTVGALKQGQAFILNNAAWQEAFQAQLNRDIVTGLDFVKGSIEQKINVTLGVPNAFSLAEYSGKAIKEKWGINAIYFEKSFPFPFNRKLAAKKTPLQIKPIPLPSQPAQSINSGDAQTMAKILCKRRVEDSLRSPSTADFPFFDQATFDGNRRATLSSYVDAQNGFGAMIRTNFVCTVEYSGGDTGAFESWKIVDFVVSQ